MADVPGAWRVPKRVLCLAEAGAESPGEEIAIAEAVVLDVVEVVGVPQVGEVGFVEIVS